MNFFIFFGIVFALGVTFIYQFSRLIELIIKGENYEREKKLSAVIFGIIVVLVVLISGGTDFLCYRTSYINKKGKLLFLSFFHLAWLCYKNIFIPFRLEKISTKQCLGAFRLSFFIPINPYSFWSSLINNKRTYPPTIIKPKVNNIKSIQHTIIKNLENQLVYIHFTSSPHFYNRIANDLNLN